MRPSDRKAELRASNERLRDLNLNLYTLNKKLLELLAKAAPLSWIGREDWESAKAWEKEVYETLKKEVLRYG
jgi:hypothetical protein